jgi:O-antigen/teichoic acid export membrane protein
MSNKKDNLTKVFITGSCITFGGMLSMGLINYFARRTLAIELTTREYGYFYAAFSFVMLIGIFLDLGLGYTANILIAKYDIDESNQLKKSKIFTILFTIKVVLGIIASIFLILLASWLVDNYFHYPRGKFTFILLSIALLSSIMIGFCSSVLTSLKDFKYNIIFLNLSAFISLIIIYIFTPIINIAAPAIGFIVNGFFVSLIAFIYISKRHNLSLKFTLQSSYKDEIEELWKVGKWIAFGMAGLNALYYLDSVMLTFLTDLKSVALYNIALPIMQIFQSLLVLPAVFIPIASSLWTQGKKDEIGIITSNFISFTIIAAWSTLLITLVFGKDIIRILFSAKYIAANDALIVLCVGIVCYSLALFSLGILNCSKHEKHATIIVFIGIIVNILLNLTLIPILNILGAAIATFSSYLVIIIFGSIKLRRIITNIYIPWKLYLKCTLVGGVALTAVCVANQYNYFIIQIIILILYFIISILLFKNIILYILKGMKFN